MGEDGGDEARVSVAGSDGEEASAAAGGCMEKEDELLPTERSGLAGSAVTEAPPRGEIQKLFLLSNAAAGEGDVALSREAKNNTLCHRRRRIFSDIFSSTHRRISAPHSLTYLSSLISSLSRHLSRCIRRAR
jgi:hypothetical protein